VFLVFSLEESAKSKICRVYENLKKQERGIEGKGVPPKNHITQKMVGNMFGSHKDKHYTITTQTIFESMNGKTPQEKREIFNAIRNEDPNKVLEIKKILKIFKEIHNKRLNACFVNKKGSELKDFKEDYEKLLPYVESAISRPSSFIVKKYENYYETEQHIKVMMKKI